MRILSFLSIILMNFLFVGNSFAQSNNTSKIFTLMKQKQWDSSYALALKTGDSALKKIVLSQQYLDHRHSGNSFEKITEFLHANPHWPQGYLLRLRAESSINENSNKQLIVKWFRNNPPLTGKGHKYYALAANSIIKDPEELKNIIKSGWHKGHFSIADQKTYYQKFKSYLALEDHIKKIDTHLQNKEITAAENSFYLVNSYYQQSFRAQIAFIKKQQNANILFKKIAKKYYTPGLIYKYLDSRKRNLPSSSEIVSLVRMVQTEKNYADDFWKIQSYLAREFIEKKKYLDAYKVASSCFTDDAANRSDAEYLSGWLALRFLNKPTLALDHFRYFNRIVKTPISKSRGIYWLGRAHEANNNNKTAERLYNLAASKYPYTFYGQVALMDMGKNQMILPDDIDLAQYKVSASSYAKANDVTRAALIVSQYGSNALSQTYIKSGVNQALNTVDILHVAHNINQSKNLHHMAWMAKSALQKHVFIKNHAYPTPYVVSNLPIETPLMYSIIRQESVFDQHAISSAEARGLMQLIKATACDTAKKIAQHCRISKLTTDPQYNITLGSNYLKQMITEYNGSYILAIAAYNGGPHNVDKWLKLHGDPRKMKNTRDVLDWLELIPFYETRNYVQRVLENLQIYRVIIDKNNKFSLANDLLKGKEK
ncbi:MAG: lytic transglycosylase domain-containing protein [Rickettsiaceae bacterium]|nr:lytic transglycosylase domain-containing protein [Rickettsiaceae bacterium]MDP5083767.1 lytic transglycosylase domain-containing protein [Rickettsiaceae bacterium]